MFLGGYHQVKIERPEQLIIESCSWTLGAMLREPISEVNAAVGVPRLKHAELAIDKMWFSWEKNGNVMALTMFLPCFTQCFSILIRKTFVLVVSQLMFQNTRQYPKAQVEPKK